MRIDKDIVLRWIDNPVFRHWIEGGKIQFWSLGEWEDFGNLTWCGWGMYDNMNHYRIHPSSTKKSDVVDPVYLHEQAKKPPLGLIPKWVYDRNSNIERLHEVRSAMARFYDAELEIPVWWIEEYNELLKSTNESNN